MGTRKMGLLTSTRCCGQVGSEARLCKYSFRWTVGDSGGWGEAQVRRRRCEAGSMWRQGEGWRENLL